MIDFKKRLGSQSIQKKINPIEIYDGLDRRSQAGPLRLVQEKILQEWWSNRKEDKDLIIKLHTGQGKTLLGLLILQSKLNAKKGPCLYVCPNKYLVKQTCQEAEKFGIRYVTLNKDNSLPDLFLNSEKILITHVQKVFNGKSIFGIGGTFTKVNTIILDDSHACIDVINDSFKIKVNQKHDLYKQLLNLFEEDLKEQGEGSFLEIKDGEYNTLLPVPYWSWQDKKSETLSFLLKHANEDQVKFTWSLIKDRLENCQCFFSGKELEISAISSLVNQFSTFTKAEHRILMSATTQNDSFFIKGLGLDIEAVKNPLFDRDEKWAGEKMILIPSLIHEDLDRSCIIHEFSKPNNRRTGGIVVITSSFKKAELYQKLEANISSHEKIFEQIDELKQGNYSKTLVVVNRYDGIDLPDDSCRILIIDSMPYANSLTERYEEECRANSDLTNIKNAQKIEQGLGRSVRGEKDYSVIILIGDDLIKFVKSITSNKFFSSQTRRQIEIGLEIAEFTQEEDVRKNPERLKAILDLIDQSLKRDEGWKEYYKEKMDDSNNEDEITKKHILKILELEKKAENYFYKNDPEKAIDCIQTIIDDYCKDNATEKGWYLQTLARYKYRISKTDSNKTQQSAFTNNIQLLKPREGISYRKLNYIHENRIKTIRKWMASHNNNYEEILMSINDIFDRLSFGQLAEKFEQALQELGNAIGFQSQRPDKEFKKGPDNLWCISSNEYLFFECKSEVDNSRNEITKSETGQMNNHCAWFEREYNTNPVKRILIIPTKSISAQGNFTHKVEIMRKGKLKLFKDNIKSFFKEFKDYQINEVSDSTIQEWLNIHKLDVKSLQQEYTEEPYQKR
ncbi:MAG: DEAD/DEAH box helicase family protein [Xenococcaceae cyanobacterium]